MAGVVWSLRNPRSGVLEPDDLPHSGILELCAPYLGELEGFYSDWTPRAGRQAMFAQPNIDPDAPW
jgi:homospermidine synthase